MPDRKNMKNLFSPAGLTGRGFLMSTLIFTIGLIFFSNFCGFEGMRILCIVFETYIFISLFIGLAVPEAIASPLSRLLNKKQFKQARALLRYSIFYSLILGSIISFIIFYNAEMICTNIFHDRLAIIPMKIIGPVILITSLNGCFKGYFNGYGVAIAGVICEIIEAVVFLTLGLLLCKVGINYGANIGNLLQNESFGSSFGVAGIMIAFGVGQLLSFIFLVGLYLFSRKYLRAMVGFDSKIHKVSREHILSTFFVSMISTIIGYLIFRGIIYFSQLTYFMNADPNNSNEIALNITAFYGRLVLFGLIPFYLVKVIFSRTPNIIRNMISRDELSLIKKRIRPLIHCTFIFLMPIMVWICCGGELIESLLFSKYSYNKTGSIMFFGGIAGLLLLFAYMLYRVALGFGRELLVNVVCLLLFIGFIACQNVFVKVLKLDMIGIVYSMMLYGFVLCAVLIFMLERFGFILRTTLMQYIPAVAGCAAVCILQLAVSKLLVPILGGIICLPISLCVCFVIYWIIVFMLHGTSERELMMIPGGKLLAYIGTMVGLL